MAVRLFTTSVCERSRKFLRPSRSGKVRFQGSFGFARAEFFGPRDCLPGTKLGRWEFIGYPEVREPAEGRPGAKAESSIAGIMGLAKATRGQGCSHGRNQGRTRQARTRNEMKQEKPSLQATFFRLALECLRRTLSICACSAASIFLFASSKLLPRTLSDSSSQTPFQLSSSGQKLQSFGTLADTFSVTGWAVIVATPFLDFH